MAPTGREGEDRLEEVDRGILPGVEEKHCFQFSMSQKLKVRNYPGWVATTMLPIRSDLRAIIAKYGLAAVHQEFQAELKETYEFLRQMYEPAKNNLVIPIAETIPDRIASPLHKPLQVVVPPEIPSLELTIPEETVQEEETPADPTLKEIILQAKAEQPLGEKFSKARHKEEVAKKYKDLTDKGIKPESLLTKENLSAWLGQGMSYMRIAREITGVNENEIAAVAKTFGLASDVKKYIVMKKGGK